jgi:hypothetical protein
VKYKFTKVFQNRFYNDILPKNAGTILPEKREKIQKNDFWGLCLGLISVKMDPEFLKKKYTVAHSIPDG